MAAVESLFRDSRCLFASATECSIWMPDIRQIPAVRPAHNGGSRATAATSDRDAALPCSRA